MNLILLQAEDFEAADRVRLTGRRHEHIRKVLRAGPGDRLRVGLQGGRLGGGEILALDREAVTLVVTLDADPPPRLPVVLAVALPRPLILRRVLHAAAGFGVERVLLFHARRVERTFWQASAVAPERLEEALRLGAEQAVDSVLPELELCPRFRPFAEERLPELAAGRLALVAHPGAQDPCPRSVSEPALLVVGPEGGLVDFEVERFARAGLRPVGLGPRILRVDTAVTALLARLS